MSGRPIKNRQIEKIELDGPLSFEWVIPGLWVSIRARWKVQHGIDLPLWSKLKDFGERRDLRILVEPVTITVTFTDSSWLQFVFERGWITDLASVPYFFRGVVDADDGRLLPAAMMHDYLFSTHKMDFDDANNLFRAAALHCGFPRVKAWLAWLAVSSPVGRSRWRANARKRSTWTDQTADFLDPRG